jgi:hypothetical protein
VATAASRMLALSNVLYRRLTSSPRSCTSVLPQRSVHAGPESARARNEAGLQQPVPQQIGNPFGVLDVGLFAGHGSHVLRVHQQQGAAAVLEHVEHRPISPDTLLRILRSLTDHNHERGPRVLVWTTSLRRKQRRYGSC